MKRNRTIKFNTLLSVLCAVFLCCATMLFVFSDSKPADANSSVSGFSTSVGEIYDYDKVCYSEEALNKLAAQILGYDDTKTMKDLLSAADRAGTAGTTIADSRSITVSYGRYGSTLEQKNTAPKALSWIPVYLSKSTEGDAILTLYLDGTYKQSTSYSRMEAYTFSANGTWSTTNSERAPSSSYGTSYMRAYVLGNGGTYYTYKDNHSGGTAGEAIVNESDANKFADFVSVVNSAGDTVNGVFSGDVVTPSKIKWQENESYAASVGQWESGKDFNFPNEAYGTPSKGTYINSSILGYGNRVNYNNWKDDKVWLPSLTEVGTGDITIVNGAESDTTNGIWKLTADERANVPGSGGSWLRTAYTGGTSPNPYTMFCAPENGKGYTTSAVSVSNAVRPAIHLNLTKISKKTTPPLNIPDTIRVTYNGATHNHASISQFEWYDASAISGINFFEDPTALKVVTPVDAGDYYIEIELSSLTTRYFLGEDPSIKSKIFKFVIEKAKLAVQWTYGHNEELNSSDNSLVPTKIEIAESSLCKIYPRDIEKEKVPVVGMKYYCQASGGPQGITEYPDVKGQYTAEPYIIGEDEYEYNYEVDKDLCRQVSLELEGETKLDSERTVTYTSWIFIVSERRIPIPEFSNGTAQLLLNYRGRQEVQIYNVTKYITITVESDFEYEAMEPDYENGIQTFWVESVGAYNFKANINDKDNIVWLGEEGQYSKTETKELRLSIEKAHITVTLTGLLPSWESSRTVDVTLNLLGLYSQDSEVNIQAIFFGATWPETVLTITDNKVTIPYGLPVGRYTFVVRMTGQNPYYYMTEQVSQTFTILTSPASFTDDNVVWQYTTGGSDLINAVTGDHSTKPNALEVPYTGNYYQFTLTMSETRLTQAGVRATYSGDTRVTNGGDYCVTVTISAYDKNVTFETKSYNLYFRITKAKYNLSGVQWNYDSPFSYTGEEHRVTLKTGTVPVGLSVTYVTNGSATNTATNAGPYSTTARFTVLPEYESNYICPDSEDASTYTGNFNFVCNWQINQKIINVAWTTPDNSSSLFFVPALVTGGAFVDYSYELYDGANWNTVEEVVSPETGTSRYRVTATLKAIYQANYVLYEPNNIYYHEFTVDSGKQAITVHIEVNGEKCDNGQQFVYTGNKFEAKPVVDAGDLGVSDFTVKYYTLDASGNKSPQPLDAAPVSVGRYVAVIAIKYENSDHSYISGESETELTFEIIRADYDMSDLSWQYIHDTTVIVAHFNVNQGKWLDNNLNDVVFEYEYDGTPHNLQLVGAVEGLGWSVTGASYTNAGEYTANIEFRPDENHNAPANFPLTLSWKITKAKVKLDNIKWGYTDISGEHEFDFNTDTLPYARNENGDVNYTVGLINLPQEIKEFFVYKTHYYNTNEDLDGNSFAAIGVYRTSFTISIPSNYNPGENYEAFKSSDMPSFISSSQVWEIAETPLVKPEFKGGWDTFDSNSHYLLDMCGIPEDQLYFFDIEITFTDTSGRIYRDYAGYEDEEGVHEYTGFHAGKYIVTFFRIVGNDKVYWGDVEINVNKEQLTVTWDLDGNIPVAKVAGIYISDMIETVYTNGSGEEKTAQYILTTDGVPFYAEPRVTAKYAHNIGFVMREGEEQRYAFVSSKFTPNAETKYLPKPKILLEEQEWTGNPITFAISSWTNYYNGYLYVSDGDLTQTAAGKYKVTLSFIKSANACWEDPMGSRSSVTLPFEIIMPTVVPLDKPVLQFDSIVYTGAATQFTIRNWVEYQNYLRITANSDNLTQTEPGTYHVTLEFFEGSTGCWKDGTRDPITLEFKIIARNNQISKPSMAFAWAYHTGEDITFIINNWSYYSTYLTYEGDSLTQREVGEYSITFSFKDGISAFWESGDKNPFTLTFEIKSEAPKYPVTGNTAVLDKPTIINSPQTYTGSPITFIIANWDTLSDYLEIVSGSDSLIQTDVKTYFVTLRFKEGVDACWKDETQAELRLMFEIKSGSGNEPPPADAQFVTKPFLVLPNGTEPANKAQYTGSPIQFEIFNWSYYANFLIIKSGSLTQTKAGEHNVVVGFLPGNNYYWEDTKDRADITLTFYIVDVPEGAKELDIPTLDNDELEFTGSRLTFTITNWNVMSQYVTVDKILNVNSDGTLGEVASGVASGGAISIDGRRIDNGKLQVGRYAVTIKIRDVNAAVWENGSTDDYILYFKITKAVLTDAGINDDGSMHIKSDQIDNFDEVLDQLLKDGVIDYEYTDANGNPVKKEDLVKGEDYTVNMVIKDKEEFNKYFDYDAEVSEKLEKTYTITYTPASGEDIDMIILVASICLGVEFVLFIILLIVLIKKRKALAEDED